MAAMLASLKKCVPFALLLAAVLAEWLSPPPLESAIQPNASRLSQPWRTYIDSAIDDPRWHEWDCDIQTIVNDYNQHLADTPGYQALDWQLIKALAWVESGGGSSEWHRKPLQIGVAHDPGLGALLSGHEGGDLILPAHYQKNLTAQSARTKPQDNIRAGVGYLLMRLAKFEQQHQVHPSRQPQEVVVKKGDSFALLAKKHGSTVAHLQALNPHIKTLQPGQTLQVQPARLQKIISGWRAPTSAALQERYNGFGDRNYAQKLDYVLPRIQQGTAATCPSSNA